MPTGRWGRVRETEARRESVTGTPAPALRGLAAYHGYDLRDPAPGHHRGLPSPWLTLVVAFDEPVVLEDARGVRTPHRAVLAGLHDVPERIVHDGRQSGIHLVLHVDAARALLGLPPGALAGTSAEAQDVLGPVGRELAERVDAAAGWDARFAVLDDVLGRLRDAAPDRGAPAATDAVTAAWRALAPGARRVHDVAREVGWSERHLERRFRAEFGVAPKVAARLGRFDRARRRMAARVAAGHGAGLAEVAAVDGFADQAHLTREFRALAGCSPSRWLAEEVGNVQDALPPEVAGSAP